MNTTIAIILAQNLNLLAFIILAFWYAVPWLKSRGRVTALTALILVHLGRTLALQLYSSQQAGMVIPDSMRDEVVVGDVAGWVLALIILVCLRYRARFSIILIWVLIAETILDMGSGTLDAIRSNSLGNLWGVTWLVMTFYVPLMMVSLGLTVWQLLARRNEDFTA